MSGCVRKRPELPRRLSGRRAHSRRSVAWQVILPFLRRTSFRQRAAAAVTDRPVISETALCFRRRPRLLAGGTGLRARVFRTCASALRSSSRPPTVRSRDRAPGPCAGLRARAWELAASPPAAPYRPPPSRGRCAPALSWAAC